MTFISSRCESEDLETSSVPDRAVTESTEVYCGQAERTAHRSSECGGVLHGSHKLTVYESTAGRLAHLSHISLPKTNKLAFTENYKPTGSPSMCQGVLIVLCGKVTGPNANSSMYIHSKQCNFKL